jgi:hypothetical protein
MAKSKTLRVNSARFAAPAAAPAAKIGYSDLAAGRYAKPADEYGFHFRRVLADGQTIDYTITEGGLLIEKINFVPSKTRRDGNAAYGRRWLGILEYRQSAEHADDLAFAVENGMVMDPPAKAGKPAAGVWKAV